MPWTGPPLMSRGAQPLSFMLVMRAPIMARGSIIRFMGRLQMDSSPVSVTSKFWPQRIPDMRRVVVPLFPQSRTSRGAFSPCRPRPWTSTFPPLFSISIPIFSKHSMVDRQSAPWRKLCISVSPCAMEPNMTARWEMDLSPGTLISPLKWDALLNSIICYLTFLLDYMRNISYLYLSSLCHAASMEASS